MLEGTKQQSRANELLPVRFVLIVAGSQYLLLMLQSGELAWRAAVAQTFVLLSMSETSRFTLFWILPTLQFDVDASTRNIAKHRKGLAVGISFHIMVVMFLWSLCQTMYTDPGRIPDTPEWTRYPDPLKLRERNADGRLRFCKREKKYSELGIGQDSVAYIAVLLGLWAYSPLTKSCFNKCFHYRPLEPDRCHFCSVSKRNILRMDHYCPWVANGVGFYNYKFFFLSLLYANLSMMIAASSMGAAVIGEWNNMDVTWGVIYFNFVGAFLAGFMLLIIFPFFCFHFWLASRNMTTIEFFEQWGHRRLPQDYNLGNCFYNFATVFGVNPHFWLWPVGGPIGDGLAFERAKKIRGFDPDDAIHEDELHGIES